MIDDEVDILLTLEYYFQKRGLHLVTFTNPVDALAHFEQNSTRYDLVLTDLKMAHMMGYELAGNIATINPEVKIVTMSAFEIDEGQMQVAKKLTNKLVDHIKKPFSLSDLEALLNKHLDSSKQE